jgi:hypothetical protein
MHGILRTKNLEKSIQEYGNIKGSFVGAAFQNNVDQPM